MKSQEKKLKAIIIDDEERAINTLRSLIDMYADDVDIVATCTNVPEGVKAIQTHSPSIVFLDIEMPEYNGFELLEFFREIDFEIIFVTAYNDYAIRAFEASAIDYLLKPVDIDLLVNAIEKAKNKIGQDHIKLKMEILREKYQSNQFKKIALPTSEGLFFIETKEIIYLEADGSYTEVWLSHGSKMVISKKLKFFEEVLQDDPSFFRSHRSYIVNINRINQYSKRESMISLENGKSVMISRNRKAEFEQQLKDLNISVG